MKTVILFLLVLILGMYSFTLKAQDDSKTVTITVSGSGKTQDEARQNALRNAIEQAFGTFISSNTQVLNDNLIKDEVVSVSNGNIQEYSIISEIQIQPDNWSNTLTAKVSVQKLTSYCESKGIKVEFKGGLFSVNIKQQELNKSNEVKVIENMCHVLKSVSENCFDYEIKVSDPVRLNDRDNAFKDKFWLNRLKCSLRDIVAFGREPKVKVYQIPLTILVSPNNNLKNFSDYCCSTLKKLSLNDVEIQNYVNLNEKFYFFSIKETGSNLSKENKPIKENNNRRIKNPSGSTTMNTESHDIILRNLESIQLIEDLMSYFSKSLLNFEIITNIDSLLGNSLTFRDSHYKFMSRIEPTDVGFKPSYITKDRSIVGGKIDPFRSERKFLTMYDFPEKIYIPLSRSYLNNDIPQYIKGRTILDGYSFEDLPIGRQVITLQFSDYKTIDQISKISGYKIMFCKNRPVVSSDGVDCYAIKE